MGPAVSFDLDGVIMRGPWSKTIQPRIWGHLAQSPGLAHLVAEEREREIWTEVRAEHDRRLAAGEFVSAWDWQSVYETVCRAWNGNPVPNVASLVREAVTQPDTIALLPGAWTGLQRLHREGVRIIATTNGYHAFQWPVLESLGVAEFFEAVITPDVAGYAKPDPRIFTLVDGLKAHVGDILLHDVLGANLAGLESIWLQPDLPEALIALPPRQRPRAPGFDAFLDESLNASRYRPFHPEATSAACTPTAVVRDVDEAADLLLASIATWTSPSE